MQEEWRVVDGVEFGRALAFMTFFFLRVWCFLWSSFLFDDDGHFSMTLYDCVGVQPILVGLMSVRCNLAMSATRCT